MNLCCRTHWLQKYKNVRPDYLKNIWKVINWKYASELPEFMMGLANLALISGERSSLKVLGPISQALHHAPQYLDGLPTVCILHVLRLANLDSAYDLDNITRFLILAREPIIQGIDKPHKTIIVFTLEEGLRVLFNGLVVFALREINLSKVTFLTTSFYLSR
ncbi:unnamed protein product [Lactuca saligna]|uniref:Manganese/iron superoxide dismutase C-terminal domain-containing protein n=1 Tax=Lactuca saligna TaxID=75948 RepID=A0AA35Y6M4_LACSI|nr:unnamed protein product [Lactuca saligna]